jgi:hypothetical protein
LYAAYYGCFLYVTLDCAILLKESSSAADTIEYMIIISADDRMMKKRMVAEALYHFDAAGAFVSRHLRISVQRSRAVYFARR